MSKYSIRDEAGNELEWWQFGSGPEPEDAQAVVDAYLAHREVGPDQYAGVTVMNVRGDRWWGGAKYGPASPEKCPHCGKSL